MDFIPNFKKDDLLFCTFQYYIIVVLEICFLFLLKYFSNPMPIIWFVYAALPWLDYYLPHDIRNPTAEEAKYLREDIKFKIPLYVSTVVNWIGHAWALNWLVQHSSSLSYFGIIVTIIVMGTFGGANINLSHELIHKDDKFERCMGVVNLGRWFYQHWYVEHLWGHHKNVGTDIDAATSKKNQSFYTFFPITVWGAIVSAWHLEKQRCQIKYGTAMTINNKLIYFMLNNIGLPYLAYKIWGPMGAFYFVSASFVSIFYMEMINYIEHYGLHREQDELVTIHHSWNTPHRVSNYVLFKLQRHSDHHENAFKPYQTLCSYDESPTMPQGYPLMVLLSLFPQRWFSIMNPILADATKQKISKAEVQAAHDDCKKFSDQASLVLTGLLLLSCFI